MKSRRTNVSQKNIVDVLIVIFFGSFELKFGRKWCDTVRCTKIHFSIRCLFLTHFLLLPSINLLHNLPNFGGRKVNKINGRNIDTKNASIKIRFYHNINI